MSYQNSSDDSAAKIVIGLIAMVIGLFIFCSKAGGSDHRSADKEFVTWAKDLKIPYDAFSCNYIDSDGDHYVTCTYTIDGEPHTVDCAASWNLNHGCRQPKAVLRSTTNVYNSGSGQ